MILLLTGCINPGKMAFTTLSNQDERKKQYVNAIQYYLFHTDFQIVFTENSGTDISHLFKDAIESGRMEYLTFVGNQDKERGKGYGECEIIEFALNNSKYIISSKDKRIVKITGRLIVKNITEIIKWHYLLFSKRTIFCAINSELSFPDSRFIIAPISFYRCFLNFKETINDSKDYYFEHALCDTIKKEINYPFSPFLLMPCIEGVSGSTGEIYSAEKYSITFAYRYAKFAILLRNRFYKQYRQD